MDNNGDDNNANSKIRTITHTASGAALRIHPFGATVVSYVNGKGKELIFVSKLAKLDGSIPIRGGIPLAFPIFGPPPAGGTSTMPQHGYARRNMWNYIDSFDTADRAGIRYELMLSDGTDGVGTDNDWCAKSYRCKLVLCAECNGTTMTTTLEILNMDDTTSFPFQALQHTYYRIKNHGALRPEHCSVSGLIGYTVTDKVTKTIPYVTDQESIFVDGEIDRVYDPPFSETNKSEVHVVLRTGTDDEDDIVSITARGVLAGATVPVSCVIWNPYISKAQNMADFDDDEYLDMICVEPGLLRDGLILSPGQTATLTQIVTTL